MRTDGKIENIFTAMEAEKGDLNRRAEQYARWTITHVCPEENSDKMNSLSSYVIPGPRWVNHLANKVVEAMFPHIRPFFSVNLSMEMQQKIRQEAGTEELAQINVAARQEARFIEELAMAKLNLVEYRPVAVAAAQHIIVTGNCLIRRLPDESRVVYGVKEFGVRRSLNGKPMEVILVDNISFDELPEKAQAMLKERRRSLEKQSKMVGSDKSTTPAPLKLYTRYWKKGKRWLEEQECEGITVSGRTGYSERDFPCILLTWSLARGENYGRGLVEEHSVPFHNLNVAGEALFDLLNLSADIRWIVNPASMLDVVALNASRRGSFHSGVPEDIQSLKNDAAAELNVLLQAVERLERELSMVFLVGSSGIRDAERVTAVEVQMNALELETSFGGLYSRLALAWQDKEARYLIGQLNIPNIETGDLFDIVITTGMETLSREGHLQQFRLALTDLQLMQAVPENILGVINPLKVAQFVFEQRGVKFEEFTYTQEELEQMQQEQQQQAQEAMANEAAAQATARGEE